MPRCIVCNTTEAIVHSGVDALMLGVLKMTEKVCYPCANKKAEEAKAEWERQMEWYNTLYKGAK